MPCFQRSPRGSSLVLQSQAIGRAKWCARNGKWVCPEALCWGLAWKFVLCEQLLRLVGTTTNVDEDVTHRAEMLPAWLCTALHSQSLYAPSHSQFKTKNAMRRNCTSHLSLWHYAEDDGEVCVGCLEPSSYNSVHSHNQTLGSEPHLTFSRSFTSIYPLTWASQGRGDSHDIIHNISVELQTS